MFIVINNISQTKRPNSGAIKMMTGRLTNQSAPGRIYVHAFALLRDKYILPGTDQLIGQSNFYSFSKESSITPWI